MMGGERGQIKGAQMRRTRMIGNEETCTGEDPSELGKRKGGREGAE